MRRKSLLTSMLTVLVLVQVCALVLAQVNVDHPNITISPRILEGLEYRLIGPTRGGRVTAVTGFPDHPHRFLMGSTGGGVWQTDDAGQNWANISDKFFKVGSIGAIAVADSDSNVVYVGTGSSQPRGNISPGIGVYRSLDGGDSWEHVGLEEAGQIGRIRVHPRNPNLVYVAALGHIFGPNQERGVYRSRDGGSTWERVHHISDRTGAVDLAMNPKNPRILYAGFWTAERKPWTMISGSEEGGVFKTTDGGDSWNKLSGGLPEGLVGKVGVAVSPVNPDRVWVLIEAETGGVYRSDDGGKSWRAVNTQRMLRQRAWYYTRIHADPLDADTVYALNTWFYKSIDGGRTFEQIQVPHGDCHDLWLNPTDPRIMIHGDDGGAQVTLNGGRSWSPLTNQPTSEIYRVTVDNQFPYRVYGAQQDSSTISLPSQPLRGLTPSQHWKSVGGCESGHIAIDPRDPDIVYAGCYGGSISRTNLRSGESRAILVYPQLQLGQAPRDLKYRFQWNAPIRISPHDADVIYHTSQVVHRSRNAGQSWTEISGDLTRNDKSKQGHGGEPITGDNTGVEVYGTVFAFEESPRQKGLLWAGSDDGLVHISRNGGENWESITPAGLPEWGTVNMIELSVHDAGRALIAVQRYRLDDFAPYIFRTNDYGKTWDRLTDGSNGIPANHFVRVVREDPDRKGLFYAGTEFGLYVSFDDGTHWQSLQLNLPVTPVTDLAVHRKDLVVATQGRAFWILDNLTVLHQVDPSMDPSAPHLFRPRRAVRVSSGGREDSSSGAVVYFYLAEEPDDEEVKLEMLDDQGKVIRDYSSKTAGGPSEGLRPDPSGSARLEAVKGLNRFVWDFRYPGPNQVRDAVVWESPSGPAVLPGTYQVRLTIGDWQQQRSFQLVNDPRGATKSTDLEEQFDLSLEILEELNSVYDEIRKIRSVREQTADLAGRMAESGYGDEAKQLARELGEKLTAIEGQLMQTRNESSQDPLNFSPMLDNQIAYLLGYVASSRTRPTDGSVVRFEDLKEEHALLSADLESVLRKELAAFNQLVAEKKIPAILLPEN